MTTLSEDQEELCVWCGRRIKLLAARGLRWVHVLDRQTDCYPPGFPSEWPNHPDSVGHPGAGYPGATVERTTTDDRGDSLTFTDKEVPVSKESIEYFDNEIAALQAQAPSIPRWRIGKRCRLAAEIDLLGAARNLAEQNSKLEQVRAMAAREMAAIRDASEIP